MVRCKESIIRRRTEGAGGFIERKGTGKVGREGVVKEAESKNSEFELNAERYRKPVKMLITPDETFGIVESACYLLFEEIYIEMMSR